MTNDEEVFSFDEETKNIVLTAQNIEEFRTTNELLKESGFDMKLLLPDERRRDKVILISNRAGIYRLRSQRITIENRSDYILSINTSRMRVLKNWKLEQPKRENIVIESVVDVVEQPEPEPEPKVDVEATIQTDDDDSDFYTETQTTVFDEDINETVGWDGDNPEETVEPVSTDLERETQIKKAFGFANRKELDVYAEEVLGIKLDGRKNLSNMMEQLREELGLTEKEE